MLQTIFFVIARCLCDNYYVKQLEAIAAVVFGNDTFMFLPTGYCKSVIISNLAHIYMQWKAMADRLLLLLLEL